LVPETSGQQESYAGLIEKLQKKNKLSATEVNPAEALSSLEYDKEIKLKQAALEEFFRTNNIGGNLHEILRSPKSRYYRTTTKRKVIRTNSGFILSLLTNPDKNSAAFSESLLEPSEHNEIYKFLLEVINKPANRPLGNTLNYIIIRGSYSEFSVIFNIALINAQIVNKLKKVSELMKKFSTKIFSSFIYVDPTKSNYYLESFRPDGVLDFKKLFGPDKLFVKFDGIKYSFHPTSFSQVNESLVPLMLGKAKQLLSDESGRVNKRLVDLYCGYGLFSIYLAGCFDEVRGVELEGNSIRSANENRLYSPDKNRIHFQAQRITGESLEMILDSYSEKEEIFLLDPPRQGAGGEVIKVIAEHTPEKVLEVFCGIDEIPGEVKEWKKQGYQPSEIIPLDMFAGTPNLEVMILFNKK
jgi:tRNA/tmRNA/rRNA uracil-C5-methylase (TrmA/RlmC/RlmD family)